MRIAAIIFLLVSFLCSAYCAGDGVGTLCVMPISDVPPTIFAPGGAYNPATLTLKLDKKQLIRWPHKGGLKIDGLEPGGRHLIVVISDGKPIQSVRFRFGQFQTPNLCLVFDSYSLVQLDAVSPASRCGCK